MKSQVLSIVLSSVMVFALCGCDEAKKVTAMTKDVPVYNEKAANVVAEPPQEVSKQSDMSEYVKKDDVQAMIDAAVQEAVQEAVNNIDKSELKGEKGDPGVGITASAIDANGNLCFAYSDGTLVNVGTVKGEKGDKGDKGDQGEPGENSHDSGSGSGDSTIHDYEKVGYAVKATGVGTVNHIATQNGSSLDLVFDSIIITLVEIDENNPSRKYHYTGTYTYTVSNYYDADPSGSPVATTRIRFDNSKSIIGDQGNIIYGDGTVVNNVDFYSSSPYVKVAPETTSYD